MSPYEKMWISLQERIEQGKTGWGKQELLAIMREIEIGTWRKASFQGTTQLNERETEVIADLETDKYVDRHLCIAGLMGSIPFTEAEIKELEALLDKEENRQ